MLKHTLLLLSLFALFAPQSQALQGAGQDVPPIQIEGDYYVINISEDNESALKLDQFVKLCQEATNKRFTYSQETEGTLSARSLRLLGTQRVPREEFYSWFQIMMKINNFACVEIGPPHLAVVQIIGLDSSAGRAGTGALKSRARWVAPEDVMDYADQPATLITTVVNLKNTDVRQLSTNLRALLQDPATENMMNAGQSSSLILTGFGSKIASIVHLLHVIDEADAQSDAVAPLFDTVPMEFASAGDVAELLTQLLEAHRAAKQASLRTPTGQAAPAARAAGSKVIVQSRTNSLLIVAMPDEMPMIKEMIARLDVDVIEPERNYHIYALQNVAANDVATVLEDFLQGSSRLAASGTGTGGRPAGGAGGSSNDVVVIPDEVTNSLLIAANKSRYAEVLDLILLLDRRQDQVLIETALIELSGSDLFNLGVELGLANLPGLGEIGGFGVSAFGLSQIDDLSPVDGIPDTKVPNLGTGFTAGILDGDDFAMPFLISAAETNENANVLNIPSVLVSNNSSATVSTTDEQPYTTVSALGSGSQTESSFGGYEEAGITMKISPSISAARYLRLGIELEISNFGNATIPNAPPPRTTRKLVTQVNVPDGDTMVIGGIISDTKRESSSRIPFLADIPGLGWLFRSDSKNGSRTSLYFFVTPHILHDEDFADLGEYSYKAKQDAAQRIGLDRVRMIDSNFSVDDELFSLEAFQLPRFQAPPAGEVDSRSVGLDPMRQKELLEAAQASEQAKK